jgi:hypothetical protein
MHTRRPVTALGCNARNLPDQAGRDDGPIQPAGDFATNASFVLSDGPGARHETHPESYSMISLVWSTGAIDV